MSQINAEEMYNWYVQDVIKRNDTALAFKESCKAHCETMPLTDIKKFVEDFYILERKERGEPEKKTDDNDFEMFQKNIRANVIMNNFTDRPETLAVLDDIIAARESGDDKALNKIIDSLYPLFQKEIQENKLEEKVWKNKLVHKATEVANRKIIGEDFKVKFDPSLDHGNCTKGINVSIQRAAEKFGISLFPENFDKENLAHPKSLAQQLENYQKSSASGFLRDIQNIKAGDIVLLENKKGELKHAMMVSGFDEQGTPLLLGFDGTQKNISMFESRRADPRKGVVLDVHAFIQDKANEHNREEIAKIMFSEQKNQTR